MIIQYSDIIAFLHSFFYVQITLNTHALATPFGSDFGPKIGGGAYLQDHFFWKLMNAWFGIASLALRDFFQSNHFGFT